MKAKATRVIACLGLALLLAAADVAAQQGIISLDNVSNLIGTDQVKAAENIRFVLRFNNNTGRKVDISNGFRVWSPDGAVWDSTTLDTIGEVIAGESKFGLFFNIAFFLIEDNCDGIGTDTVAVLGAGIPSQAARQLPVGYNDTALAITAWSDDLRSVGKTICIDTCFFQPGGTWKWVRIEGGSEYTFYPAFQGLAGRTYSTGGYCFQIEQGSPVGAGEISIARVSDLVGDGAVAAGRPVRFLLNFHNSTGDVVAAFHHGFRVSSPDGASWDSTTIDTVGYAATGTAPFTAYFDLLMSLQAKDRNGISPDSVAALGVANLAGLPNTYDDSAIAVTAWFHDTSSVGKHICLDSSFIPPSGNWVWMGQDGLNEYYPGFLGLPGQAYTPGAGYCFEIVDAPAMQCRVLNVPGQFATIEAAVSAANDCDTIVVQPGTYSVGQLVIEKRIVIRSAVGPLPTTLTTFPSTDMIIFRGAAANGAVLEGFTVDGGYIGIWCQNAAPVIRRNVIKNQTITNWAAVVLSGPGYGLSGVSPAVIENNTIVHAANGGISTFSTVTPIIRNNIIAFNGQYGIHNQNYSQPLLSYNDIFGNPGYATANVNDLGPGALAADPMFADSFFKLSSGSPCIDAGNPDPIYNDPDGTRNDMGALSLLGGTPSDFINIVQWRKDSGGNDHWYGVLPRSLYWVEADVFARQPLRDAVGLGYLATITSAEENAFILGSVVAGTNQTSILDEFWLGGRDIAGQWTWMTGEPFMYTNWGTGEPNNVGIETALGMWGPHTDEPGTFNNSLPDSTVNQLHRFWSVVEWGVIDSVPPDVIPTNEWILTYCAIPKLDRGLVPPGSVITAHDPVGVLCGATRTNRDGSYDLMPIYRDDPYTRVDEGCQPGDLISFRINGTPVYSQPPVHWTSNGDRFEVCQFLTLKCQEIRLHAGWNLISWNVALATDIETLIAPIRSQVEVVLAFDRGALSYDPDLVQFSTLSRVDHYHGYWFKMNGDATLRVCGGNIEQFNNVIPIYPGWNLVGYWPDAPWSVSNALMTVMNNLQVAIGYDLGAQLYVPGQEMYNTLTHLKPGFGYWIRSAARDGLEYFFLPTAGSDRDQSYASAGGNEMASRDWMSLYGKDISLDGQPLAENASIDVFTADGVKVGQSTYAGGMLKFMPVYGYDANDQNAARYPKDGDLVNLFVDGVRTEPSVEWHGSGPMVQLSSLNTAVQVPHRYALGQNFPNPFNPQTTISFDLPNATEVKLTVYNMLGQKIRTLADQRLDAGQHQVLWDGRSDNGDAVASGIYLYRLEADSFVTSKKMILLK